eukprot:TRINITY_DN6382_c0_g1_i1.p2 TRINITY_DN6382_c0_g1~~TRINITY_DN6382_c0_g1_i1.p2  ORF type:complete len:126 (+),score=41.87 TRINITY_DN6382_c0_g1_i1:448-825(+)
MFGFQIEQPKKPDRMVVDGESIPVGEGTFEVVHTPGHTPGQVVFHCKDWGIAFTGDMLFAGSVGRTDFPRSDPAAMVRSLHRLLDEEPKGLPGKTLFFPGHNQPSTIGEERESNVFWLQAKQGRL